MLKHKLMRSEPATLAEMMKIADKYATDDSGMLKSIRLDANSKMIIDEPAEAGGSGSRRDRDRNHNNQGKGRTTSRTTGTAPHTSRPLRTESRLLEAAGE